MLHSYDTGGQLGDLEAARRLAAHLDRHGRSTRRRRSSTSSTAPPATRTRASSSRRNHNLDVINDIAPEGMFSIIARQAGETAALVRRLPVRASRPDAAVGALQPQVAPFDNKDVRWALALLIDIRAVAMGSYRGAANLAALSVPPTGTAPTDYFEPMQEWLTNFELDTGTRKIKPYDPDHRRADRRAGAAAVGRRRSRPTRPSSSAMFGYGWWKQDIEAATELLQKAGFTKDGNQWMKPDGTPVRRSALRSKATTSRRWPAPAPSSPSSGRWSGIDDQGRRRRADQRPAPRRRRLRGRDLLDGRDLGRPPRPVVLPRELPLRLHQAARARCSRRATCSAGRDARLDAIIEANRTVAFDRPKVVELGMDYLKLAVEEMPMIPLMAYNKFAPFDTTYWTGYPSVDNPYSASGPFWSNLRYMIVSSEAESGRAQAERSTARERPRRPLRSDLPRPRGRDERLSRSTCVEAASPVRASSSSRASRSPS